MHTIEHGGKDQLDIGLGVRREAAGRASRTLSFGISGKRRIRYLEWFLCWFVLYARKTAIYVVGEEGGWLSALLIGEGRVPGGGRRGDTPPRFPDGKIELPSPLHVTVSGCSCLRYFGVGS